jgi:hypothetical protein
MHNRINGIGLKCLCKFSSIRKVPFYEKDVLYGFSMAGLEIIKDNRFVVLAEKLSHHMTTDISRPARYKNC